MYQRNQDGRRCVTVEVLESEIDALVRKGLLGPADVVIE
jgi:hypothetical protein